MKGLQDALVQLDAYIAELDANADEQMREAEAEEAISQAVASAEEDFRTDRQKEVEELTRLLERRSVLFVKGVLFEAFADFYANARAGVELDQDDYLADADELAGKIMESIIETVREQL